mmetsp:Transcript_1247/g.1653  ORF Transcript_1247/g.1653 Transcript_1247/m.1653 type:complete len:181 (-) Transcript_1247:188-730(-)|eukprot:CAMPEP_0185566852 /NCGR_PEP_ID=MMETSP0434-20130131/265_1 /TAXON_ID=626734 ORGANISM="Favella taraikaensis, Strain Fe Narragansett Bay" /NCGR_SAMPLE_ID=MMETSP0434 /ASSEMBLY_ACC=CAM_ASM_000379 /LENGTH=180 /DNA_ID=CAMNT_0028180899 /DNA_START=62 /DNA_END=604 /DNA_ORIENTATION=+
MMDVGHKIEEMGSELDHIIHEMNDLPDDAAAQWAAGLLYGASKGTIDKRDYIVGCSWSSPIVKRQLTKAYDHYEAGEHQEGNKHMKKAEPWWRLSMATCWKTNKHFNRMHRAKNEFFNRDDWKDIVQGNYDENRDYIDQQWAYSLKSWDEGVYFNAGMFYAYTFAALSKTDDMDASQLPF